MNTFTSCNLDEFRSSNLDYFPENILIEVLSYLSVRERVRAGRVCKRWKRLVKDQRLWRLVDLTAWKGVTSHILWLLLRVYLGCGLRCLRLRGLLLSARGGTFLSESWLRALSKKCPRLSKIYLLHADLRSLSSCRILPPSLQVLELFGCELPREFFNQTPDSSTPSQASSSDGAQQQQQQKKKQQKGNGLGSPSGVGIRRLTLNNVPSFTDQHLQSLTTWEMLTQLQLRDTFRVTANGLRTSAAKEGLSGVEGLSRLKSLEIGIIGRQGYQLQMASLGLGAGWLGLEELSLGGKEVGPGLLCTSRLKDLKCLCLWSCMLGEMQIVRSCRKLRGLQKLEFTDVVFQPRQRPPEAEGEGGGEGREEQNGEEEAGGENSDEIRTQDTNDLITSLRRSLAVLLPSCTFAFTRCSVELSTD